MGVAFCLTAFWGLPFLLRVQYTAHFRWTQKQEYSLLFPNEIRPYLLLTLVGLVVAVTRGSGGCCCTPGRPRGRVRVRRPGPGRARAALWNARMLPFLYLFSLLVAAYGASVVAAWLAELLQRRTGCRCATPGWPVVAVMVVAPVLGAWRHRGFVDDWARYNYSGFEVKEGWPEARALFNTLDALPPGRVMWEFNRDYERFGTTRTLENIPVFGGQPTMEGLLIESSMNAPFHFINQKETSKTATEAVPGVPYERFSFDFPAGLAHLRLYGVRYYVAYDACQNDQDQWVACARPRPAGRGGAGGGRGRAAGGAAQRPLHHLRGRQRQPGRGAPLQARAGRPPDWRATGLTWYAHPEWLETPLVFASSGDPAARPPSPTRGGRHSTPCPGAAGPAGRAGRHDQRDRRRDQLRTDRVGEPHRQGLLVPQLEGRGRGGAMAAAPALMVVVPTQPEVRLSYRDTPVDLAGKALTVVGVEASAGPDGGRFRAVQTPQSSLISAGRSGMVLRCPGRRPPESPQLPARAAPTSERPYPPRDQARPCQQDLWERRHRSR